MPDPSTWFIENVADAVAMRTERFGTSIGFETRDAPLPEMTMNVRVLQPGQPTGVYHQEGSQECALVLSGECVAIVEDSEHPLRKGDFVHFPRGTAHIIVGAGNGPAVVVMAGSRPVDPAPTYPVSEQAARYDAAVAEPTADSGVAYAGVSPEFGPLGEVPW